MGSCPSRLCRGWAGKSRSSSTSGQPMNPPPELVEAPGVGGTEPKPPENAPTSPRDMVTARSKPRPQKKTADFVNAVYYPNWRIYNRQSPATLNLDSVSHILYAFAKPNETGSVILSDKFADLEVAVDGTNGCVDAFRKLRREKHPNLKLILSIGGGAYSQLFNEATSNMIHLERFVYSVRKLVTELGLDGIDIDWQIPSNEVQGRRYTHLLARLRAVLPSPKYIVTSAVPAALNALKHMNLGEAADYVDMINLMAYDFVGPFPGITKSGHQSQLRAPPPADKDDPAARTSGEAAIKYLLEQGVAREKIILGIPLYGRSFLGASGPGQPFHGHGGDEGGTFEYRHLPTTDGQQNAITRSAEPDDAITPCTEQYDATLAAAWRMGPHTQEGGGFITYDNARSVEAKARFVKEQGLGGLFYWHIGCDRPRGQGSLVDVGGKVLGVGQRRTSWHSYYR